MKKISLILIMILTGFGLNAQQKPQYLEVDYQMEMKMDAEQVMANVPAAWKAQVEQPLRDEIKKGIFMDYKLKTNGTESEYKMQEKINNDQTPAGIILAQLTSMDKEPLYKNIQEKYFLKPYNMGKSFLVKDSLQMIDWKISKEKLKVAGFDTYKATGMLNDSIPVTAWYTPKISIKDGPDRLSGLPGLILKTEFFMNGTELIITATNVAVKEEEIVIVKPENGQIVNEEEFVKEMQALQKKYMEMYSGGVDSE